MSTALVTLNQDAKELIAFAHTFLGTAQAVRITSAEEAQAAVDQTRSIKECAKAVEETRKSYTAPLDDQKKAYMDAFRPAADVLAKAEQLLKASITQFQQEEQRKAAILDAERQMAEQAERARIAEEQRKADELLRQAAEAAASGDMAATDALIDQAMAVHTVPGAVATVPVVAAMPQGAAMRKTWKCRVVDASLVPEQYRIVNQAALDAFAKTMKDLAVMPGCEFYSEDTVAIR